MQRILLILCLLTPLISIAEEISTPNKLIRMAATTSIENSGLLKYLLPKFMRQHDCEVDLTVVGSGKALRLARTGKVDVVWVHSPPAEMNFVAQGYGINRQTVMRNDFVLVGPTDGPGNIAAADNILQALQMIAKQGLRFVSRGDDSGTNKKELSLWERAGIDPYGSDWYLETGVGMAASLLIAQEEQAYMIIDRATFEVRHGEGIGLLLKDPVNLSNPYSVIAVNPDRNAGVNLKGANEMINWLVSREGQGLIESYTHRGQQLYYPTKLLPENTP